jgi:uncharacterized protein YjeT (DUF2065 family)
MTPLLAHVVFAMGVGRILIGLAPFVAAGTASRMLRFPSAHDSPTTRLMARLFGVRDIGLGVLVFYALAHPEAAMFLFLFNACMDAGDLFSTGIPLVGRHGIDRAAVASSAFAFTGGLGWICVWTVARAHQG